jgi:uncharacterized protein YcbX
MLTPRITSLHVYPVKSCRAIDVRDTKVTATGLEWDRRWMIVDSKDRFITQRTHPRLTAVTTSIFGGQLRLATDGLPQLAIDLHHDGPRRKVEVWKDSCVGVDAGQEASDWLLALMGEPLRLVRIDESVPRLANPEYAGPDPHSITFTDGYPMLLISRASLEELNRKLPAPLPMNRFRPSIVIEGVPAHAEDALTIFRFGRVAIRGVKPCTRCVITTTDQKTGMRDAGQQPLKTLKTYRWDRKLKGITFGQNCVVEGGVGETLAVGAELAIDPYQV